MRWEYVGWPVDKYGRRGNFDYRLYQAPPAGGFTTVGFVQSTTAGHPLPGFRKSLRSWSTIAHQELRAAFRLRL